MIHGVSKLKPWIRSHLSETSLFNLFLLVCQRCTHSSWKAVVIERC